MELNKISPSREKDRKWRVSLTEQMLDDLQNGRRTTGATIGKMTKMLSERIATHDYTEDDARHYRLAKIEGKIADIKAGFPLKELTVK